MKAFSYTKSQTLVRDLEKIENLKRTLLLVTLSPKEKKLLRWRAKIDRIYYSLLLSGINVEKEEIITLLDPSKKTQATERSQEILRFRDVLDYIYQEWLVTIKPVTASDLTNIYEMIYKTKAKANIEDLENSLRYVQANPDNPIVQASLAEILVIANDFFGRETSQMAKIISLIFLYKYGYDFRGMVAFREYYYLFKDRYNSLITQSLRDNNATSWIEFCVDAAEHQLNKTLRLINSKEYQVNDEVFETRINDRQRSILGLLDKPGTKISNKVVQKAFKVSPITAARDLGKLTSMGMLFPIGKGRSTYYTKM